ncbi:MAG: hypothetical protein IJV62_03780 [Eggerthellaceae bacterium]|nr:hypothetical protein [Eggerthellaceae bacterium]
MHNQTIEDKLFELDRKCSNLQEKIFDMQLVQRVLEKSIYEDTDEIFTLRRKMYATQDYQRSANRSIRKKIEDVCDSLERFHRFTQYDAWEIRDELNKTLHESEDALEDLYAKRRACHDELIEE